MGENALYRLASAPMMARVGRSVIAARKEVAVARWLAAHNYPAVELVGVEQPVLVDGVPVTFWEFIEQGDDPVTSADLGAMLCTLHRLPVPEDLPLPQFDPMPKLNERLAVLGDMLPADDKQFLDERKRELDERFRALNFELGRGPVHGDAHRSNLLRDRSGTVRLLDLEDFAWGPQEWDVCVEAVRFRVFGWVSEEEYRGFVAAYGFDPLEWSGFETVRAIRELNMTTWLAQLLGQSQEIDVEVARRVADLRDDQAPREWRPF